MTYRPRIFIDLMIIASGEALIAEEVDGFVIDAGAALGRVFLGGDVLEGVGFVPAFREDVEGDLAADCVAERRRQEVLVWGSGWRR